MVTLGRQDRKAKGQPPGLLFHSTSESPKRLQRTHSVSFGSIDTNRRGSSQMDMQIHNIRAARKVAGTINTLKILTLVLVALGTVFPALGALSGEQEPLGFALLFIGGLIALTAFATFGWFEHTLNLLCDIAFEAASVGEAANPDPGEATA